MTWPTAVTGVGASFDSSAGRFLCESRMLVSTHPGHSTEILGFRLPRVSSRFTLSDSPTTANFVVQYSVIMLGVRPANEAVFTMCPSVSCLIMMGKNVRMP
jgi:hypothetical protein